MREPPVDLPDTALAAALRTHYGLAVTAITFLPLGQDSSAWVYRVQTAEHAPYFLKLRQSVTNASSLLVPRYLQDAGVAQVVAPLRTTTGVLWLEVAGYALILYPFIAGTTGMASGMTDQQWITFGTILRQIHTTALAPDLAHLMQRETFVPVGADMIRNLDAQMGERIHDNPTAQDLATFWNERRETIHTLVARAEMLGQQLAQIAPPCVLCHADMHTNNVMLDASGAIWIVDWDDTVLAPKERDLMFVMGGGISRTLVGPREEELFLQGYGATTPDSLALTYYRHAWAVSDIGAYGEQILFRPDLGAITKRAAMERFASLFMPGNIVALAFTSARLGL